jgi:hypothetical protein
MSLKTFTKQLCDIYAFFDFVETTNIQVLAFITKEMHNYLLNQSKPIPQTVQFILYDVSTSWIFGLIYNSAPMLPQDRNEIKDTFEYIATRHLKHELLEYVFEKYPIDISISLHKIQNTELYQPSGSHYAWIDIEPINGIQCMETAACNIKWFSQSPHFDPDCILFPGCYSKITPCNETKEDRTEYEERYKDVFLHYPCWRFCGGFFVGDRKTITDFVKLYKTHFPAFLHKYRTLTWDFNFWAWMEFACDWHPSWYASDHNHRLYDCYPYLLSKSLHPVSLRLVETYPKIPRFFRMNTSYLCHPETSEHIINIRYVNYFRDSNIFDIYDDNKLIRTKNIVSILDASNIEPSNIEVLRASKFQEVTEKFQLFEHYTGVSCGLEDIRLFYYDKKVKCIASSIGYSSDKNSYMYIADYDISNATVTNEKRIYSPGDNDVQFEKNWIPVVRSSPIPGDNLEDLVEEDRKSEILYIIYKWEPFQIGRIVKKTEQDDELNVKYKLKIVGEYKYQNEIFNKLRGSSIFIPYPGASKTLVGLAHYIDETNYYNRKYYHVLVLLDEKTLRPVGMSYPFYFRQRKIEYCIGLRCNDDRYTFWVSEMDRNLVQINVSIKDIPITLPLENISVK